MTTPQPGPRPSPAEPAPAPAIKPARAASPAPLRWLRATLRFLLAGPLAALVAAYTLLGDLLRPLVAPLIERLARLEIVAALRAWVEGLGPYQALLLLVVPLAVVEPLKLVAVYWTATGHAVAGVSTLILLYVASLLTTERLFTVAKPKLLTIGWFAVLWRWFEAAREWGLSWLRATWVWQAGARLGRRAREAARALVRRVRVAVGW